MSDFEGCSRWRRQKFAGEVAVVHALRDGAGPGLSMHTSATANSGSGWPAVPSTTDGRPRDGGSPIVRASNIKMSRRKKAHGPPMKTAVPRSATIAGLRSAATNLPPTRCFHSVTRQSASRAISSATSATFTSRLRRAQRVACGVVHHRCTSAIQSGKYDPCRSLGIARSNEPVRVSN